jgi:hypothetical protein
MAASKSIFIVGPRQIFRRLVLKLNLSAWFSNWTISCWELEYATESELINIGKIAAAFME